LQEMKQVGGVYLPSTEQHLVEWMLQRNEWVDGKLTYQFHKLQAAMKYVRQFDVAVDIGAHCGLWSMHLAKRFAHVYAFEPMALYRSCFKENVQGAYTLFDCALGRDEGTVAMCAPQGSSGGTHVIPGGTGDVQIKRLDVVLDPHQAVDFVKVDCEGFELFVLQGAEQMLRRCRPCIIVEQKPPKANGHKFAANYGLKTGAAVDYLQSLGAVVRQVLSGDYIMSWEGK
jgi:FkbM family methyltransferase